jgi:hypothetical protein
MTPNRIGEIGPIFVSLYRDICRSSWYYRCHSTVLRSCCTPYLASIGPFNSFVSAIAEQNHFPTRLQILGVEVFPSWSPLLRLISMIRRRRGEELITVKLPGFSHPSILRPLLDVLKNRTGGMIETSYGDNKSGEDSRELSCSACLGSGWRC